MHAQLFLNYKYVVIHIFYLQSHPRTFFWKRALKLLREFIALIEMQSLKLILKGFFMRIEMWRECANK